MVSTLAQCGCVWRSDSQPCSQTQGRFGRRGEKSKFAQSPLHQPDVPFWNCLRKLALSAGLPLVLMGISLLAFAVNIVELLQPAGTPAVYAQHLALNPLPLWQH